MSARGPFDISVTGIEDFAALSRRLKAMGDDGKGLRKELYKAIFRATRPVKEEIRQGWKDKMPSAGGLADKKLKVTTRTRSGGPRIGIRISTASKDGYDVRGIDQGRLRHPVFGNRKVWVAQSVESGIVTDPQEAAAPNVRAEIVRAINDINRQLEA